MLKYSIFEHFCLCGKLIKCIVYNEFDGQDFSWSTIANNRAKVIQSIIFLWILFDSVQIHSICFIFRPAKILQKSLAESNFLVNCHLNEISEMKGNTTKIQWLCRTHFMILIDFWRVHQISILKNFTELELKQWHKMQLEILRIVLISFYLH